jgi:hypothetical protein
MEKIMDIDDDYLMAKKTRNNNDDDKDNGDYIIPISLALGGIVLTITGFCCYCNFCRSDDTTPLL